MSAVTEKEPGLPDQEQEDGGIGLDPRQIVLHVLPIEEVVDDIDRTAAFLVSQAVTRAFREEEYGLEEIWPAIEEIWPPVEEVWPGVEDIWPDVEEVWPDVEEDWYIWNSDQEEEVQDEAQDNRDHSEEDEEVDDDDDDNYEYEEEKEIEGENKDENQGEEIILHACKTISVLEGPTDSGEEKTLQEVHDLAKETELGGLRAKEAVDEDRSNE